MVSWAAASSRTCIVLECQLGLCSEGSTLVCAVFREKDKRWRSVFHPDGREMSRNRSAEFEQVAAPNSPTVYDWWAYKELFAEFGLECILVFSANKSAFRFAQETYPVDWNSMACLSHCVVDMYRICSWIIRSFLQDGDFCARSLSAVTEQHSGSSFFVELPIVLRPLSRSSDLGEVGRVMAMIFPEIRVAIDNCDREPRNESICTWNCLPGRSEVQTCWDRGARRKRAVLYPLIY